MKLNKNNYINRVGSFGSARIRKELDVLEHSPKISRHDKDDIINKLFYKLGKRKQRYAFGFTSDDLLSFGNTPPVTVAQPAVTVAPVTAAVSVPVSVAPTTVPVSVAAPATVPASIAVPASVVPPITVAPPQQQVPAQAATTSATIVQPNPYGSIAGATQQLEQAAQQLLQTAAGQNISGFGQRRRSAFQRRRRFY